MPPTNQKNSNLCFWPSAETSRKCLVSQPCRSSVVKQQFLEEYFLVCTMRESQSSILAYGTDKNKIIKTLTCLQPKLCICIWQCEAHRRLKMKPTVWFPIITGCSRIPAENQCFEFQTGHSYFENMREEFTRTSLYCRCHLYKLQVRLASQGEFTWRTQRPGPLTSV